MPDSERGKGGPKPAGGSGRAWVKYVILAVCLGTWIKIGIDLLFAYQLMGSFAATVYSAATAVVFRQLYFWLFASGKF